MSLSIQSPYSNEALPWLKGNLHTHSTQSDGLLSPEDVIATYAALGYDFLMISDHDHFSPQGAFQAEGMTILPGNEITAYGAHLLHLNAHRFIVPDEDRQQIIREINTDAGLCIVCHPNWQADYKHCPQESLEAWRDYAGIEIYNGVCRRLDGSPLATDRWDQLLSQGRRVWGFANDDFHEDQDQGIAWNMLQCEKRSIGAIVDALSAGRFYASTGVNIQSIQVQENCIRLVSENATLFHLYTNRGRLVARVEGPDLEYYLPQDFSGKYLRIECFGHGDTMAWTQPFFIQ